ncbi:MAG: DUF4392 domain-containing protein [Candidatus Nezhaarchaeota archaeon]|nr:DUF4392 domain-containing protein [Candidatus Nezhaarchaeota archaeon]
MEFKHLCEELDKILRLDLGFRRVVDGLYLEARSIVGKPLTQAFSETINAMRRGHVMVITGFKAMPKAVQETDGPPGAVVLAKTLTTLGFSVSLAIEEDSVEVLETGLEVLDLKCPVHPLPVNAPLSDLSRKLLEELKPSALIFVEKAGANDVGVYHNMLGVDISKYHAKVEKLLEDARSMNCKIIAIGDGGNEVGFGLVKRAVRKLVPRGSDCGCPCRGGIAASSKADVIVVSSISNIGCYAASCALLVSNNSPWFYDRDLELKLLKAMVDVGAVDAMSSDACMMVDGVPVEIIASLVDIMSYIVERSLKMKRL